MLIRVPVFKEFSFLFKSTAWWIIVAASRGAGKTFNVLLCVIYNLIKWGKGAECAYFASTLVQAKNILRKPMGLIAALFPPGFIEYKPMEGKYIINISGSDKRMLSLYGYQDLTEKAGFHPPFLILDECGYIKSGIFRILSPMVEASSFSKGGKVFAIGTTNGKGIFFDIFNYGKSKEFPHHESYLIDSEHSHVFTKDYLEFQKQVLGPIDYAREFLCDWNASYSEASVYGKTIGIMRNEMVSDKYHFDPTLRVYTGWDFGLTHRTCIWFWQMQNNSPVFIDYYENFNEFIPHYVDELKRREYQRGYRYACAYLPHDGARSDLRTPLTLADQLSSAGICNHVFEKEEKLIGIERCQALLKICKFNEDKCSEAVNWLAEHSWQWDKDRAEYSRKECDNEYTDRADAFRISCRAISELMLDSRSLYSREPIKIKIL